MNKLILKYASITILVLTASLFLTVDFEYGHHSLYANAGGSPGGKTNSPGDVQNCTQCHTGNLNPGNATTSITSTGLSAGYTPGQTYTINAAIAGTSSSKIGFEVTVESDANNSKVGTITITDAPRTKTVNGGNAITHNASAGTAAVSGANAWSFDWTAPTAGTGNVTFHGAFNVTNGNLNTQGDEIYTAIFSVQESITTNLDDLATDSKIVLYPNPTINGFGISSSAKIETIQILDLSGKVVFTESNNFNHINTNELAPAIYFVKIITKNSGLLIEKLVIK